MKFKPIDIEILEEMPEALKVKVPFLDVPIEMNYDFFEPRFKQGYFKLEAQSGRPSRKTRS